MKKTSVLSILLLLCLTITSFVACNDGDINTNVTVANDETAESEDGVTEEDEIRKNEFEFKSNGDGTCELFKAVYVNGDVEIPEFSSDGDLVTSISEDAFRNCTEMSSLIIPDCVITIGDSAFKNCSGLKKVTVGMDVAVIEKDAFYGCDSLDEVHISDLSKWCQISFSNSYANPLSYGYDLYLNDELVTELVIPEDIHVLKKYTFDYCQSIVSVVINEKVTRIEYGTFSCCTYLETVIASENLKNIGDYAFYNCLKLKTIPELENVKEIGAYAFAKCQSLDKLTIPSGIETIADLAFNECIGIKEFTLEDGEYDINSHAFDGCPNIEKATLPLDMLGLIRRKSLKELTVIGEGKISKGALSYTTKLTKAVISEGIVEIGSEVFKGCTSLEVITLPTSLKIIDDNAFEYCMELSTVNYAGSEAEWNAIEGIEKFPNDVKINFNYKAE